MAGVKPSSQDDPNDAPLRGRRCDFFFPFSSSAKPDHLAQWNAMREGLTAFAATQDGAADPIVIFGGQFLDPDRSRAVVQPIARELLSADFSAPLTAARSPAVYAVRLSVLDALGELKDGAMTYDGEIVPQTVGDGLFVPAGDRADALSQIAEQAVLLECRADWQAALDEMTVAPDTDGPGF